jgi:hypothetical protein
MVQYSVRSVVTLQGRITAREYVDRLGNQVYPMIRTLFPNNDAVFNDNTPIHIAGTVQSLSKDHEGELQHLPWPAKSPDLNIIELLWSVLETRTRNRFPPPTSLKQLQDVLQEDWYKIPLETVRNLFIHSSMALQPFVGPWPLLQFHNIFYTDGRTFRTSDQPVTRPLPTHRTTQKQNKRTQTSMPLSEIRTQDPSVRASEDS